MRSLHVGFLHLNFCIGNAYIEKSDFTNAAIAFMQATDAAPEMHQCVSNLGICLLKLNQLDGAKSAYSRAVELEGTARKSLKRHLPEEASQWAREAAAAYSTAAAVGEAIHVTDAARNDAQVAEAPEYSAEAFQRAEDAYRELKGLVASAAAETPRRGACGGGARSRSTPFPAAWSRPWSLTPLVHESPSLSPRPSPLRVSSRAPRARDRRTRARRAPSS